MYVSNNSVTTETNPGTMDYLLTSNKTKCGSRFY